MSGLLSDHNRRGSVRRIVEGSGKLRRPVRVDLLGAFRECDKVGCALCDEAIELCQIAAEPIGKPANINVVAPV